MGQKLEMYFNLVRQKGTVKELMRLAMKGGFTEDDAKVAVDSPENLDMMHRAAEDILGESLPRY